PDLTTQIVKICGGLILLILLVLLAAVLAHLFIKRTPASIAPDAISPPPPVRQQITPTYEVFSHKAVPPKPLTKLRTLPGDQPPLVAIIVDDIGYDRAAAQQFIDMDAPLTLSVLPHGPFSQQLAANARAKGHEIMLHLPMEPSEFPSVNPGPGALLFQMTPDQLIEQLTIDLDLIPGIKGVNNHMGSALSESSVHMRQIFSILKKRGLYYIDSRTTAKTVGRPSARLLQLPFAERDIFIDHFENERFIRGQLDQLIERAKQQGFAVGIAHPHPITHNVLSEFMPVIKQKVELVPASMVVEAATLAENNGVHTAAQ
ncbi:MAG: divergent polysaccharide deacetylase family protein, partial [Desulfobacteraceae bacterium]